MKPKKQCFVVVEKNTKGNDKKERPYFEDYKEACDFVESLRPLERITRCSIETLDKEDKKEEGNTIL